MNLSLNGAKPLSQQTIMLRGTEAVGKQLLAITPDLENPTFNNAVLKDLDLGTPTPPPLTLASGAVPAGKALVWMGIIYADGVLTPAVAYR